jgi:FkbM family methyltransferase
VRLLHGLATVSRNLPPSRTKVRAGRLVSIVLGGLGLDPRTVTTLPDGSRMLLDPRSRTEAGAFWDEPHEADYVRVICHLADSCRPVVYDVGANVGLVTIPVAMHVRERSGKVVCFEPVPENHQRLVENLRLNDLTRTCFAYPLALAASEGKATMEREAYFGATTGNALFRVDGFDDMRGSVASTVEMARLDDVIARDELPMPDVIKLDVEGSEVGFLTGARETLNQARPVVLGEFNSDLMPRFGHTFLDAVPLLPHGYLVFGFVDADTIVGKSPSVGLGDVLLVPQEKVSTLPLSMID